MLKPALKRARTLLKGDALGAVLACDIDPDAIERLRGEVLRAVTCLTQDFLALDPRVGTYDVVLANPPFTRNHSDRLERELVAKQKTALSELVKNGYEADATEVEVRLFGWGEPGAMEIRDNGIGMDRDELVGGFLRLASDNKVREPRSPNMACSAQGSGG